jgi:hypothetical protein
MLWLLRREQLVGRDVAPDEAAGGVLPRVAEQLAYQQRGADDLRLEGLPQHRPRGRGQVRERRHARDDGAVRGVNGGDACPDAGPDRVSGRSSDDLLCRGFEPQSGIRVYSGTSAQSAATPVSARTLTGRPGPMVNILSSPRQQKVTTMPAQPRPKSSRARAWSSRLWSHTRAARMTTIITPAAVVP